MYDFSLSEDEVCMFSPCFFFFNHNSLEGLRDAVAEVFSCPSREEAASTFVNCLLQLVAGTSLVSGLQQSELELSQKQCFRHKGIEESIKCSWTWLRALPSCDLQLHCTQIRHGACLGLETGCPRWNSSW